MKKERKQTLSRDNFLNIAHDLFLSQGFSATSLDQICHKAKLTKGAFFHYFKSKDELGKAVLDRFCEVSHKIMQEAGCCQKCPDPLERVFSNLDCVVYHAKRDSGYKGCLLATFTQEMSISHPEIQAMCAQALQGWAKMIKVDLSLAKKKYKTPSSLDIESLADYCVGVVEGAQVLAKATNNPKIIEKNILHLKQYLRMLFIKKQTK